MVVENFKKCRPFVELDECFLTGYYGGQIFAAMNIP
jgi:hypothetical protein